MKRRRVIIFRIALKSLLGLIIKQLNSRAKIYDFFLCYSAYYANRSPYDENAITSGRKYSAVNVEARQGRFPPIGWLIERYKKEGKKSHLRHLSDDCRKLLKNAENVIDVNIIEDPTIRLLQAKLVSYSTGNTLLQQPLSACAGSQEGKHNLL